MPIDPTDLAKSIGALGSLDPARGGLAPTVEDGQVKLAQGPCAVALSRRSPVAIRDLRTEPEWGEPMWPQEVTAGQPLPANRRALTNRRAGSANDRRTAAT
jgi:hypothetical protein